MILNIAVFGQVTAHFSTNTGAEACQNDTVVFTNTSTGDVVISYWDFGDGYDTWADNPKHIYQSNGHVTVSLTVYDEGGASNTATIDIVVNDAPIVSINNNPVDQSLSAISNDTIDVTYQWLINSDTTVEADAVVYYLESGNYTTIVTNSSGCSSSASIYVDLGSDSASIDTNRITVLNNILTPGVQDGANDVLFIEGLSYFSSSCIISVYNKWGQLVYYNDNYTNFGGFEGRTNQGNELDAGTYLYVIKSAGKKTTTGYIDLIR